jgi:murein DD-endopeptidase MepM/ murein hydrolase activator NlpD
VWFPVDKKPGNYQLRITVPKKSVFKKQITVAKRTFPVDTLEITKEQQAQGYTAKKIIKTIETKENTVLNKVLNVFDSKTYAVKPFTYPLSTIDVVGSFGDIRVAQNQKIQHLGVDLKATVQTPVYAVNDGKVVFAKSLPDYGNIMVINHGLGVYSLYLHLADFNASEGQMVAQGDTIAHSGDTGYVTGPHLHFSIKVRGAALDPLQFIKASQAQKSP